ncbi:MAG: glycosyltransferase family 87 protein [Planctomycetota bacterium]
MSGPSISPPPRDATPARGGRAAPGWIAVAGLALVIGMGLLVQRGAQRALDGSWDFTMIYAGARQVVLGGDPYDFESTFDAYAAAGGEVAQEIGDPGRLRDPAWFHSLYPPTAYTLLAPVGTVGWENAKAVWLVVNLLAVAGVSVWLVRQRPRDPSPPGAGAFAALAVGIWWGSAALHTALAFGQMSVLVLALMLPAIGWRTPPGAARLCHWHAALAGLLLAVAGWLKPQLVGPITVVLLATPRRAVVGWAAGWGVLILVGSVAWIASIESAWLAHWRENLRAFTASGLAEPSGLNPYTYQLIHLEPWLHRWWPDGIGPGAALRVAGVLVPAAVWLGATAVLAVHGRAGNRASVTEGPDARCFAAVALAAVLTMLMAYHRTYDAVLLVLPSVWAWRALSASRRDAAAWAVLVGVALFTVPGPVALEVWSRGEGFGAWLRETWLWRVVLLPHHSVALVVMAACLAVRVARGVPVTTDSGAVPVGEAAGSGETR